MKSILLNLYPQFLVVFIILTSFSISAQLTVSPTASVTDGEGDFHHLEGARDIAIVVIEGRTYALVAATDDDGVQIIDISNPARPTVTASVTDGQGGFDELEGAHGIATVEIGDKTYALVASYYDDGVQIIDISDPADPTATASVRDGNDFDELDGAYAITTVEIGQKTYALVAAADDDGVQIMQLQEEQTASTKDLREQGVLIYPNPAYSHLHMVYPSATQATYTVYELRGKALSTHHQSGQSHSIDVSGLAKGIYLLKATHNNNTTAMQFVKQ